MLLRSKDVITLRTSATSPAQIGPLAFFGDSDLQWVKSPKPVFSEEEEASIWTGQCPVCPPRHTGPICESAGVMVLLDHGSEVQHVVAGPLKDDHVTQGTIIEGRVGMTREPQFTDLPGETRIQHVDSVAPHLLPCTPRRREEGVKGFSQQSSFQKAAPWDLQADVRPAPLKKYHLKSIGEKAAASMAAGR